jgi:histidyl-tRNA synthetase
MINEKGLSEEVADRVWSYVQMHGMLSSIDLSEHAFLSFEGNADLIEQLRNDTQLTSQKAAVEALNDLELLFRYLRLFNVTDKVNCTRSLGYRSEDRLSDRV